MSLAQALTSYLNLNLMLLLAALTLFLLEKFQKRVHASSFLRLHYLALTLILGFSLVHPFLPRTPIFEPAAKVWSAKSMKSFSEEAEFATSSGFLSLSGEKGAQVVSADKVVWIWSLLALVVGLLGGGKMVVDLLSLYRIRRGSFLLRKIGRVQIHFHEQVRVPFSYMLGRTAYVVVPMKTLENPIDFRIALAHEIQHHRQKDTVWVYGIWFLRLLCIFNPIVHLWNRRISELQEFACDEALLLQRRVDPKAYARCLVEVAQNAFHREGFPACATGLTFLVERNIIKRRIEEMLQPKTTKMKPTLMASVCAGLLLLMGTTAIASKAMVQDRRVSMKEAMAMAEEARKTSEFPIVINDLVLAQLNRYVGTPEGRESIRASLQRMENYRTLVAGKIQEYDLPMELMAVPLIESGYQNLADRNQMGWGAGLWMFIKSTAKVYGLRVDDAVDERLNEALLTDAAMRYLKSNFLRFRDWQLAAFAYNIGESNLQKGIDRVGSRDAFTLIRNGVEGDKHYLARLMAAILILKNPETVK